MRKYLVKSTISLSRKLDSKPLRGISTGSLIVMMIAGLFVFTLSTSVAAQKTGRNAAQIQKTKQADNTDGVASVLVTAPIKQAESGHPVVVNLTATDTTGLNIAGYRFELTYNPNVIQPNGGIFGCDNSGTISASFFVNCNIMSVDANTDKLLVFAFSPTSTKLSGAGTLLKIGFNVVGAVGTSSPLHFADFYFNEGGPTDPVDVTVDGSIIVVLTTAATSSISGAATDALGRGIGNVRITLTDQMGVSRSAITNPFGFFRFDDVTVGSSYIISGSSKQFSFQPQALLVGDEIANVVLIGQR